MNLYATCCESAASPLAATQYPPIAPSRNQVVKLLPQPSHLLGRNQIMPGGTQNQIHKAKQPQQILPKPIPPKTSPQKQSVSRLNTAMPQQTPLLINQPQTQSSALLLNQVLTSGAPVLVQPAGPGGTVHLMLRTPTPTLQSGPGPPQNKMIIANAPQPQPQATVLIQNRQQVVRFMTAQGPMQLQQIQTPSGPQFIAIPQNQSLSFPTNSVLVQGPTASTLQLQQNSANTLQLRQSPSALIQSNSFPQTSLPSTAHSLPIANQLFTATSATAVGIKGDEKLNTAVTPATGENPLGLSTSNDQKKNVVIDNKTNCKKNINAVTSTKTIGNNFSTKNNSGNTLGSVNPAGIMVSGVGSGITCNIVAPGNSSGINVSSNSTTKKGIQKNVKTKVEDESNKTLNKNLGKGDNLMSTLISAPATTTTPTTTTAQKNLTSSLRQIRPGTLGNRNKQNQNIAASESLGKEKSADDSNSKSMSNLTRIIDSVASNTEHLIPPSPKIDNLTATINSVAENIKSPEDIMSKLSLTDVFIPGNKSLNLNKRPNLTIVQKGAKSIGGHEASEEPNVTINRLVMSPGNLNSGSLDFESNFVESIETRGMRTSAGVQTVDGSGYVIEQTENGPIQGRFQNQDEGKKGKKNSCGKKKGKKEESRVDLWDLMKSAGIGDDEFDEPSDISAYSQDPSGATIPAESLEISDSDLLAQIQSASQLPGGIRVVVGEDGRPVIINSGNVLIPENVQPPQTNTSATESSDADAVLQNMILPENLFNFTPQAFATAQTQLNQLIQDHGDLTPSSSDQQLLSQIFGASPSIAANSTTSGTSTSGSANFQSTPPPVISSIQNQSLSQANNENILVNMSSTNNNNNSNNSNSNSNSSSSSSSSSSTNTETCQATLVKKSETKSEFIGEPPPGLPPLGPDSLVITNNNGVPTLVASPALMQYLQAHQGIIQFQHDPVTKTIQPSLIIPHPQPKIEQTQLSSQENRTDKMTGSLTNNLRNPNTINQETTKVQNQMKTSVGTTTSPPSIDIQKSSVSNFTNSVNSGINNPNLLKVNMVKFVKGNPSLLQIATEMNNLIGYKERNKTLTEKEIAEIDRKIHQNRLILDQCLIMENNRVGGGPVQNVIVKDGSGMIKDARIAPYQVGNSGADKLFTGSDKATETQTLEDLQNLDMTLIKGFHPVTNPNPPSTNSDFQAKFLESIGITNNKTLGKATVSVGTATIPSPVSSVQTAQASPATATKRSRKKKEKIVNQATQADVKVDVPSLTFNIAELTPEQNIQLNQALQSRGALVNQIGNLDAIKRIIHEEVRKITSGSMENSNIRFVGSTSSNQDDQEVNAAPTEQSLTTANVILSNPNLNQLLDQQPSSQSNVISIQGNELIAINSGNQQIFTPPNQVLTGNHFVSSNNQILAVSGGHNQLVSLGNPINASNQIVTLGNSTNLLPVSGSNVTASPGAVIVGGNGNVVAIVHQNTPSGQNPGIVQKIQAIQLTQAKQQQLKSIQSQIQTLSTKMTRTAVEQATLQNLIVEQQKILSSGKLIQAIPGQQIQGMQIVSPSIANASGRLHTTQASSQQLSSQLPQSQSNSALLQSSQTHTFMATNSVSQPSKPTMTAQKVVSCGTNTSDFGTSFGLSNIPKMSVPPTVLISDAPTSNYGPLYVSPNTSGKNVTKCEKGTSPIQIQMGTQTMTNMEYRNGKMSTGTMTSPNTGKPQAVVAPAIVIQQAESPSPTFQMKPRNQTTPTEPLRTQVPALSRTAFIEQQMRTDQAGATMPDTKTPFLSKSDACKRLIRYHVMDEKVLSSQDLATADEIFEATAQHLLDKFRIMKEKYKYLLMLESMKEVSTAERIMVDRNFIIEERMELEDLREKEKRLQEEFENPTVIYRSVEQTPIVKTEFTLDDVKKEMTDLMSSSEIKCEAGVNMTDAVIKEEKDSMISSNKSISYINSDSLRENCSFKLTEANRCDDFTRIKSETKECKNTRTMGLGEPWKVVDKEEDKGNEGAKCKAITSRTFSEGSSKSSLDGSRDEDSGTDINAQVQSAIDSILNLQRSETMGNDSSTPDDMKRSKKKRKSGDKSSSMACSSSFLPSNGSKRLKTKAFGSDCGNGERETEEKIAGKESDDDADGDEDEGVGCNVDPILDEAVRSILTS